VAGRRFEQAAHLVRGVWLNPVELAVGQPWRLNVIAGIEHNLGRLGFRGRLERPVEHGMCELTHAVGSAGLRHRGV
jgi:hypothetical protein